MKTLNKIFLFLTIISFAFQTGIAQDISKKLMISPAGDTVTIKPIPVSEITSNIENSYASIKKIEGTLAPGKQFLQFDSIYSAALISLDTLRYNLVNETTFYSLRDIDNALNEWENYSNKLNEWRDKIRDRIKILEQDNFEVSVSINIWDSTNRIARKSGIPADVLSNVTELTRVLKVLQKEIQKNKNSALGKQNEITELRLVVDEVTEFLLDTRKNVQSDYFRQDQQPIWKSADSTASMKFVRKQISKSWDESIRNLQVFYRSEQITILVQVLIFIILWLAFFFLHKHSTNINELDEKLNLNNARSVISNHGLSALVITLFSSIWLYSTVISTVTDIIQLLYILISLLFLPGFFDKRLRIVLLALLGLFIANEIQIFLSGDMFSTRLVMLIESFISGWIIYKIISPKFFIAKELKKNNWDFVLKIIPILYVFVFVQILANIFGFVKLASLLTNTTVNALFNLNILIMVIMVVKHATAVVLRTPFAQKSYIIRDNYHLIEKRIILIIQIIGIFLWTRAVLHHLGLFEDLSNWFYTEILQAKWRVGDSEIIFDNILTFILVIITTYLVYKALKELLKDEVYPRVKLPRGVPGAITMISGYIIAGYGIYIALVSAGVDLSTFGLVAGALGVGIGFGLQGIVANFIAGLVLAFERPIQVGDTIEIGTMMGDVTKIGVRASQIRTFDGSEVIVPNSSLITNDVTNWTLTDRRKRRDINIGVAYGSDLHAVMDLLTEVANNHPEVLKIPAPWILFDGFGDSSLNFRVRIWTTMDNGLTTKSSVAVNIYDALQNAGFSIPFPQRDLHLRSIDPSIKGFENSKNAVSNQNKTVSKKQSPKSKIKKKPDPDNTNDIQP